MATRTMTGTPAHANVKFCKSLPPPAGPGGPGCLRFA
jgi:hypothetical protein